MSREPGGTPFPSTSLPCWRTAAACVAFGIDLPGIEAETRLSPEQRAALAEDLADRGPTERTARSSGP